MVFTVWGVPDLAEGGFGVLGLPVRVLQDLGLMVEVGLGFANYIPHHTIAASIFSIPLIPYVVCVRNCCLGLWAPGLVCSFGFRV